ncbi:MAG: hypothetical protein IPM39_29245 [Chloroflexi bacterium]|nr:hypothetical protein [Chloroflexota bacterium]
MSDVYAVFGTLLALGIAFPGLIFTWWLLFPGPVSRAETQLTHTPGRTFFWGLLLVFLLTAAVLVLVNLPLPGGNFTAVALVIFSLAVAAVGAAGLTHWMAQQLRQRSNPGLSAAGGFLRAVVALELAAAFPIIGWFLFIPLCLVLSLGAAVHALISRPAAEARIVVQPTGAGDAA